MFRSRYSCNFAGFLWLSFGVPVSGVVRGVEYQQPTCQTRAKFCSIVKPSKISTQEQTRHQNHKVNSFISFET